MKRESSAGLWESDLSDILTLGQFMAILQLQSYGWETRHVRTPRFQEAVVILQQTDTNRWMAVFPDGEMTEEMQASCGQELKPELAAGIKYTYPKVKPSLWARKLLPGLHRRSV